ncbi:MAG: MFS transporter [Lachnospiraceae bacterium]|nr:MFS transporter [Lachnospiraceae bacterium]
MTQEKAFNKSRANFGIKGWIFIFYVFVAYFVNCLLGNSWQVAGEFWSEMYGWNTTTIITCNSIGQFLSVITGFIIGWLLVRKVSAKLLAIICSAITFIAMTIVAFTSSFAIACLCTVICTLAVQNWTYSINSVFVATWFPRKKGIVMGLGTIGVPAGSGLCAIILYAVAGISNISWAMFVFAVIALVGVMLAVFYVTDDPAQRGYHPDNDETLTQEELIRMKEEDRRMEESSVWTPRRILATKTTYLIVIPIGLEQLLCAGTLSTLIMKLSSYGFGSDMSVKLILVSAVCAMPASYLFGLLDSKVGPRRANMLACCMAIASFIAAIFVNIPCLLLHVIFLGAVVGGASNFLTSTVLEYWGKANFKRVYGVLLPLVFLIGALGPAFCVQVATRTSYMTLTIISLIFACLALLLYSMIKTDFVKKRESQF